MRQILAGIVALLVSLLGIVAPTAAMTPESPTQTPAYAYDGHPHLVVLTHTITERGPSHHHTRTISLDAADPLRQGSSTRPQGASVGTITTYDHPSTAGLVALATRTMQRFGEGSHVAISSPALSRVAAKTADVGAARFAQNSFSETFSKGGLFSGRSIDDVAGALRSGAMSPKDVPIDVIVRGGNTLILNTRSAQALTRAGISRGSWNVIDRTGQAAYEARLSGQLGRNGLGSAGTDLP